MKYYTITVNGVAYSVSVEETAAGAAPVAAAPAAPAPAAAPKPARPRRPLPPLRLRPRPPPAPPALWRSRRPCPATSWTSRSSPAMWSRPGDALVVLEAMKMENEIVAPQDGTVATIDVNKGDVVNSGDTLVTLN